MTILRNPRHEAMAQALANGETQTNALILAGFKGKHASSAACNTLKNFPGIRQRCEELIAARNALEERARVRTAEKDEINRGYVRSRLQDIVERCMTAEPVLVKGVPTGVYVFDSSGANRALELLGKDLGMFVDRKEVGTPGSFASVAERKEAEGRIKAKMVRIGLAKVVGIGSMVGRKAGEAAGDPVIAEPKSTASGGSVEIPTPVAEPETDCRDFDTSDTVENSTPAEPEPPDQVGEPEPEPGAHAAADDIAPLPPGIIDADPDLPDPAAVERAKPVHHDAEVEPPRAPEPAKPAPEPLVDPGPGPDRAAYRRALRIQQGLSLRDGTPVNPDHARDPRRSTLVQRPGTPHDDEAA